MKALFIIPDLSGRSVSYPEFLSGESPLSCARSSWLHVAGKLSERGHEIGALVLSGDAIYESPFELIDCVSDAAAWSSGSSVVACSWGNEGLIEQLEENGLKAHLWVKSYLDPSILRSLEVGRISSIIVPSDFSRLHSLHSSRRKSIGRIYNPLHPAFEALNENSPSDVTGYLSKTVVFSGNMSVSKGAHEALLFWRCLKKLVPEARLVMAGSGKLYQNNNRLGSFGLADKDFESKYIKPLIDEFGSLGAAGVEVAGMQSPLQLANMYKSCALGLANLNRLGDTETFGCSAVEMLAAGLPVIGFSAGALPESIGLSGGAVLKRWRRLEPLARLAAKLLSDSNSLQSLGSRGAQFTNEHYSSEAVVDKWEELLTNPADSIFDVCRPWRCPNKSLRYYAELAVSTLGAAGVYRKALRAIRSTKSTCDTPNP